MKDRKPLVSISCITYNHAYYIRECLDGFLMQRTNFLYEVIIHDDCSTDGTQEIIREYAEKYPDIFFPMYQEENQYSKGVRGFMSTYNYPRCRGKYIASCEGDDYWVDPDKLQKQVDFLESNFNYIACTHQTKVLNIKEQHFDKSNFWQTYSESRDLGLKEVVSTIVPFHTSSFVFKRTILPHLISFNKKWNKTASGDIVMFTLSCKLGPIRFMNEEMSIYRVHYGGVTSRTINKKSLKDLLSQYILWSLLSKEFSQSEQKKYFLPVIQHYEYYLLRQSKKLSLPVLLEEIKFLYQSNPIELYTKLELIFKIFKNKLTKSI